MDEKSNSSAHKKEDSSNEKQSDGSSQKITNFFPLLRTEGRAKMCALKTDDTKQKEMLKRMRGKESMTLRSKKNDKPSDKSANGSTSSQGKEKIRNISVASALKTPLSQVLRKSIEAADKKEIVGKPKVSETKVSETSGKIQSESKKSLSDCESGRTLRQKTNTEKPVRANTVTKRRTDLNTAASGNEKVKQESTETPNRGRRPKSVAQSLETVTEEGKSDSLNSNSSSRVRRYRKRHFRGTTYGLYLTPARKKKKKMKSQDESKDDECSVTSTENNSFLDSEDGNSFVSEDFFTPSEKSLVDEEHGITSQNSTALSTEKKFDKSELSLSMETEEQNSNDQAVKVEKSETKIEISADYEENTQNVSDLFQDLDAMQWESNQKIENLLDNTNTSQNSKPPQYDDVSSESFTNSLHFSFKKNSEDSEENYAKDDLTAPQKSEEQTLSGSNIDCDAINKSNEKIDLPETSQTCLSINDNMSEIFDMKEDSNVDMKEDSNADMKEDSNADMKEDSNVDMKEDSNIDLKEDSNVDLKEDSNVDMKEDSNVEMKEDSNVDMREDSNVGMKDDSNAASSVSSGNKEDMSLLTSAISEIKDDLNLSSTDMLSNKDNLNLLFSDINQTKEDLLSSDITENKDLNVDSSEVPEKGTFNILSPHTYDESRENSNQMADLNESKNSVVSPLHLPEDEEINNSDSLLGSDFKQDSLPYADMTKQDSNSDTFANASCKLDSDTFSDVNGKLDSDTISNENKLNFDVEKQNSLEFSNGKQGSPEYKDDENKETASLIENESKEMLDINENKENQFDPNMDINHVDKLDDENDTQSTIATCVKSRQRIKRRFTDDIVDTDLGILSVAAMASVKKSMIRQESPKDVIESFQSVTRSEVKKTASAAKIECVFNCKQSPIKFCTCESDKYPPNPENDEIPFCQAVDSIDDKLLGCANHVVTPQLVRSSVKHPFMYMCEIHLWRLKHHHACPYCGLFCSQGPFIQCTNTDNPQSAHLFHEQCQSREEGIVPFCFHCGCSTSLKRVHLEMHMSNPPAFFLSQSSSVSVPDVSKARISFSESSDFCKKEDDEPYQSYQIEDSDKILSSAGLPKGAIRDELEKLLIALNDDRIRTNFTNEDLYDMAAAGDVLKVLEMLVKGFVPNQSFPVHENGTPLHAAAANGHLAVVHLLMQAGAVHDALNDKMYTPLMMAVENEHVDVVHYLVRKGSFTDFKGENGMSSLHLAAKSGNLDVLKILMSSRDVDIDSQDDGGWTPIVWASEHDHLNVVKYLLKRGANPNIRDNEGNIGLHWSAFSGSVEISYLYLDYGCDINAVNELGDTPLHIAARQDSFPCVTLFLSRGADVTILNKAGKLPAECCIDKNSDTYLSLSLNMLLKKITKKYQHKPEKILHRDISRGKEQLAIQCVNAVDDEMPPLDFLYVTENCETMPIKIDRTITSLQSCHCEDDCSTASCSCASISYQCWYDKEGLLLPEFNLLDPPMLFECNRACSCWSLNCHNRVLQNGITSRLQLIRTQGKGWGVRTLKDIPKGAFICEYVGELISDSAADKRSDDSYLFDLDNRDGETYCLDARYYGNISRFINHLCEPNLVPVKVYVDHQDLNFPRIAFFSSRDIKQYEELGFDYGEKFWAIKYKSFTCECGTPKCKYSKESIHVTLANYYRRLKEEQMEEIQQPPIVSIQ